MNNPRNSVQGLKRRRETSSDGNWSQEDVDDTQKRARLDFNHSSSFERLSPHGTVHQHQASTPLDFLQYQSGAITPSNETHPLQPSPSATDDQPQHIDGTRPSDQSAQTTRLPLPSHAQPPVLPSFRELFSTSLSSPPPSDLSLAHDYHGATVSGNARVQMGNVEYHCSSGSYLHGPSTVAGNMTVNNTYYQPPQEFRHTNSQDSTESELKKALYYNEMDQRRYQLDQVDPASFEWIWTQTDFPDWLETGEGLFWIQGKPASGKSTLVNYLISKARRRVIAHLEETHPNPSVLHFFFDFRAGSGIANTIVGLLRSFILQLMDKSDPVKQYLMHECGYQLQGTWPDSQSRLLDLLRLSMGRVGHTVCAFVDGLDEYQGDLNQLGNAINYLQSMPGLKVCIGSRPHAKPSYRLGPHSLTMQHHNAATIRAYTEVAFSSLESSLSRDFNMQLDQTAVQRVVQRIQHDADGVILWAKFAVDEVVSAIVEGKSFEDAVTRLDGYPSELGDIYHRLLHRLDDAQKREAGVILFIVTYWDESFRDSDGSAVLSLKTLLMAYNRIMYDVYKIKSSWRSDSDEIRFRLRVQDLLGGLIEFVSAFDGSITEARLVHKSFDTFMRTTAPTDLFQREIQTLFTPQTFALQCLALNFITASKMLIDETRLPGDTAHEYPSSAFSPETEACPPFSRGCIGYGINLDEERGFLIFDDFAALMLIVIRTRIYKNFSQRGRSILFRELQMSKDEQFAEQVWAIFPQVFDLIYNKQWRTFEMVLREDLKDVSDEIKMWLQAKMRARVHWDMWSLEHDLDEGAEIVLKRRKMYASHYLEVYEEYKQSRDAEMSADEEGCETDKTTTSGEAEISKHDFSEDSENGWPSDDYETE